MAIINIPQSQTVNINNAFVPYYQFETTNASFINMHYYLKRIGIHNNKFFLVLWDKGLAGVDPYDETLSKEMKIRILRECTVNYWYFLREVVRIPVEGGYIRYELHRGNLAMNFAFTLNYNMYVELPRQTGKTVATTVRYLWIYNFGTKNSSIMFIHKDHNGSKGNLKKLKDIRDALPSYLQMSAAVGIDGKKLKVPNTVIAIEHPINHNKVITFPSARSKDAADKLGRGCTMANQYYDEFGFMMYNDIVYGSAMPAYEKAAENAASHGSPYGVVITTTPGDLTTEYGVVAYNIRNDATPWSEAYYDYSYEKLEELRKANTKSPFFLIRFSYKQLGKGAEYFSKQCTDLLNQWDRIRREILLEWAKTSSNCPFRKEDLDVIGQFCIDPIRTIPFGSCGQYQVLVYEDINLQYPPIIGVDVSGAMYHDSSAITIVDSHTTRVSATFNCNYIPTDDLADLIYVLVKKYMPNAVINIERNGGFGRGVVERLVKSSVKRNLYYEIKERIVEESFNGYRVNKNKQLVRVYGIDSTAEVRARLIEILYERVAYHKDKFVAKILHDEMEAMEVKKSGKVEHSDTTHDDQVFSYLMALYVWYDGHKIMENFNIQKNTIKTDEDVELVDDELTAAKNDTTSINLESDSAREVVADLDISEQYIVEAAKSKTTHDFNVAVYNQELQEHELNLGSDNVYAKAFNDHYHNDSSVDSGGSIATVTLPDSAFCIDDCDNDDDIEDASSINNGNLWNDFKNL